jgi:Flp pilus assembly protein TadD
VSLLMDALRKAEQQKQKLSTPGLDASEPAMPAQDALSLEPISRHTAPLPEPAPAPHSEASHRSTLPELPSSLESLDEQFLAHAAQSKPAPTPRPPIAPHQPHRIPEPSSPPPLAPSPPPKPEAARESARNVFEAKQPQARNNRSFAIAIGLISLVAAIGIGAYFWWQLQPKSSMVATMNPPPPPLTSAPVAPTAPAVIAPSPVSPPVAPPVAVSPAPSLPSPMASARKAQDEEEDAPAPPRRDIKAGSARSLPATPAVSQPESPVRKTTTAEKTDPLLTQAHAAYSRGESELARQAWQKVLAKDSRNLDALRGLAVVAQQNQQLGEAASYYQRALEVDPKDAIAMAGLMAIRVPTDMVQAESRLKTLLAEQPDSAYLNFALGNQLARQQRWADAQQAYFKAYTAEPANAGYVFNLAVSLDQLHQAKLAARYYNEALAVAERQPGQPAGFDRTEVLNRLNQLQATVAP